MLRCLLAGAVVIVLPLPAPSPAGASSAGVNGGFVFSGEATNADGTRGRVIATTGPRAKSLHILDFVGGEDEFLEDPDWSPDGKWIAYDSYRVNSAGLKIVRVDGSHRRFVCRCAPLDSPAWSPAGRRIAFVEGSRDVVILRRDGTDLTHVLQITSISADIWLDWSRRNLLVVTVETDRRHGGRMFTIRPDGTHRHRLFLGRAQQPDWAPGGRWLTYVHSGRIWVIRADGCGNHPLGVGFGSSPTWSPDGSKIAYVKSSDGAIHAVARDGAGDDVVGRPRRSAIYTIDWRPL